MGDCTTDPRNRGATDDAVRGAVWEGGVDASGATSQWRIIVEIGLSAGHLLVAQLEREGVKRVYGVPGESYLDLLDGMYDSTIEMVITRHEGGAGFMALAEARLTGRPGVAAVTRGPGAANAAIAVHTAYQDATPLVLFVGLIPVTDRGREAFQEFELEGWFGSTSKKVVILEDPAAAARVVADAMHTAANGRPGPVIVGLPEDVLTYDVGTATVTEPLAVSRPAAAEQSMDELRRRLNTAERPLMIVGGEGWHDGSGRDLVVWAARHGIPVLADFRAYDAVPHAYEGGNAYVGALGYGRLDQNADLLDAADLHVLIGTVRGDVMSDGFTLGQDVSTVIVAPGSTLGHSGRIDQLIVADPQAFVRQLPALTIDHPYASHWLAEARSAYEEFVEPRPDGAKDDYVDLGAISAVIREEIADDAVITYGAGNHAGWATRYVIHRSPASLVAPRNGAMGVGIPAAVAASLVFPGRQVVSFAGDGCFMMNGQEIATAVAYGARFTALVFDNGVFGTIRDHQTAHYPGRPSGTALVNPKFDEWAQAFGAYGARVDRTEDFRQAFRDALRFDGPSVISLRQDPAGRPPSTSAR